MQLFLEGILPRLLPDGVSFQVMDLGSKQAFLKKVAARLCGYRNWLPDNHRVVLVVDSDTDDCEALRSQLLAKIEESDLSVASASVGRDGQVLPRIAVEMLEAWYFGDTAALGSAYGKRFATLSKKQGLRVPDQIRDPARRLEHHLRSVPKHRAGLKKTELSRDVAEHFNIENNSSASFVRFREGVRFIAAQIQECHAS